MAPALAADAAAALEQLTAKTAGDLPAQVAAAAAAPPPTTGGRAAAIGSPAAKGLMVSFCFLVICCMVGPDK